MARAVMKNGHSRPLEDQHDNDRLAIPFTGRSGDHDRAWNDEPIDIDLPPNPTPNIYAAFAAFLLSRSIWRLMSCTKRE